MKKAEHPPENISRARPLEFIAILVTGAGQVLTDSLARGGGLPKVFGLEADAVFNLVASVMWASYLVFRMTTTPALIRSWGFRKDNLLNGAIINGVLLAIAIPCILLLGYWLGRFPLPGSFWLALSVYPAWGIAQQFALQNLVQRNLAAWVSGPSARTLLTATFFSLAHAPDYPLMVLTFLAGSILTWVYLRVPNIWMLGLCHGILGTMAYYIILGRNPLGF
jgi:membrane protease YdiL (CAAX protease family)